MTRTPSLSFDKIIKALQRDGWVVVRQNGSHIRLQKHTYTETLKLTIPVHNPIKRSTLAHILKLARLTADRLNELL
ncbi:MAG: type II toxin-antitoxin system HicA family toxin [Desulfomonilaceae bacterium]